MDDDAPDSPFPVVLPFTSLADALGVKYGARFRAALEAIVARGGAVLLDGDLVGLSEVAAGRLGLQSHGGHWFTVDPSEEETEEDRRRMEEARVRAELARRVLEERRTIAIARAKKRKPAKAAKPAVAVRPRGNSFDLGALRRAMA